MDPDYGRQQWELYAEHWWWRPREEMIFEVLRRRFRSGSDLLILDVGCGDGLFFDRLRQFGEVEGIEPVAAWFIRGVRIAQKSGSRRLMKRSSRGDATP